MSQLLDQLDVNVFKNANTEVRGQVFNVSGAEYPIPNTTFILSVKARPYDTDAEAYLIKSSASGDFTILDSDLGIFKTEIVPADLVDVPAGEYQYDIQMTQSNGKKYIIQRGRFVVFDAITGGV